jgi:hypothetical protein
MSNDHDHVDLERDLPLIVERLQRQFHNIDPSTINEVVRQCAAQFDHVHIKNYVCVLTEKLARDRLLASRAA